VFLAGCALRSSISMPAVSCTYARMDKSARLLCLALLLLLPSASITQQPSDRLGPGPSPLLKAVVANQEQSEKELDQYERIQREEGRSMSGPVDGKIWRVFPTGTGAYKIPLSPDGKPLSPEGYRHDLEKLEKYLVWVTQTGSAQQEAYAKAQRKRKERFDLLEAMYQAFIFTRDGEELRAGRTLLRFTIKPNPSYKPTTRNTIIFKRVQGTVWIDEQSSQMAKIEGTVTEDISLALFVAKVYKGSHFMQERYEVAPGVWQPSFEQYDFDGRKFFSSVSIHERTFYSDYKRVGPPQEAVQVVRAELNKLRAKDAAR